MMASSCVQYARAARLRLLIATGACLAALSQGLTGCGQRTDEAKRTAEAVQAEIVSLEERQASINEKLERFEQLVASRRRDFPPATLWLMRDRTVYRTAAPDRAGTNLAWVILHDGVVILQRMAKEMKLETEHFVRGPGVYTIYLSAFGKGGDLPVSNLVSFRIDDDDEQNGAQEPAPPTAAPSATPAQSASPSDRVTTTAARLRRIASQLHAAQELLAEFDLYAEQQATLPQRLELWVEDGRLIRRSVGPEKLEQGLTLSITSEGGQTLNRRIHSETQYVPYFRGAGESRAVLMSGGQPVSNEVKVEAIPADQPLQDR